MSDCSGPEEGDAAGRAEAGTGIPASPERARRDGWRVLSRVPREFWNDDDLHEVLWTATHAFMIRVGGVLVGVVVNIALARALGPDGMGLLLIATTVAGIAAIVGRLGVDSVVVRFGAVHAAEKAWRDLAGLRRGAARLAGGASAAAALALMLGAPWIAVHLFGKPLLVTPLRVLAFGVVPFSLATVYTELLRSAKRIRQATAIQILAVPVVVLAFIPLLTPPFGVEGAAAAHVIAAVLMAFLAAAAWRRAAPESYTVCGSIQLRPLLRVGLPLLWVALLGVAMTMTDTLMLGVAGTAGEVGIYGVATQTAMLTSFALVSINSIAAPKFAALHARGNRVALSQLARRATAIMIVVTAPLLIAFTVTPARILGFLYGAEFSGGAAALAVLAIGQFIHVAMGPVGYLLMMSGHEKALRNCVAVSAMLNVVLNAALIPPLGIVGAAAATATSLAAQNLLCASVVYRRMSIVVFPMIRPRPLAEATSGGGA